MRLLFHRANGPLAQSQGRARLRSRGCGAALLAGWAAPLAFGCGVDSRSVAVSPSDPQQVVEGNVAMQPTSPDGAGTGLRCGAGTHACDNQCVSDADPLYCGQTCEPCSPAEQLAEAAGDPGAEAAPEVAPPVTECPADQFLQDGSCHLDAVQISVSGVHACVVLRDTTVRCVGGNSDGQLGSGTSGQLTPDGVPIVVQGLSGVRQISAADRTTCAVVEGGAVYCWGRWLTSGSTSSSQVTPRLVPGIDNATAVSGTCALLSTGVVTCWGENAEPDAAEPIALPLPSDDPAVSLSTDRGVECALLSSGKVMCRDSSGLMYSGPQRDVGFVGAVGLARAFRRTCAWNALGELHCLGAGFPEDGGLGADGFPLPSLVTGLGSPGAVALGQSVVCVVDRSARSVRCKGDSSMGTLGDPSFTGEESESGVTVAGLTGVSSIAVGGNIVCALREDGSVWCWGALGDLGVIGLGKSSALALPIGTW